MYRFNQKRYRLQLQTKYWLPILLFLGYPIGAIGMQEMDHHAHHRAQLASDAEQKAQHINVSLHPEVLQTQNGKRLSLTDDIGEDTILVMNFIYTTCTTVCPVSSAVFQQLQDHLVKRQGNRVKLISVSVDPVRDTPQRLKNYSQRFNAGEDWLWLTGEKRQVDRVLEGLGAYTPDFRDHPAMVLVGDPSTDRWVRFFGFPSPERLLASIDELTMGTNPSMAEHHHHEGHNH